MKTKLLPISLIILILLNAFLVFMLITKSNKEDKPPHPKRDFLVHELKFDQSQAETFRTLDMDHRDEMMQIDLEIRQNKNVLFNSFGKENINIDSITNLIGIAEAKKDKEIFRFFSKVKNICTEDQKSIFDDIIKKALQSGRKGLPNHNQMPPPR